MKNTIQEIMNWNRVAGNANSFSPELEKAMLTEELNETLRAVDNNDIVEIVDGVLDTFFVSIGTLYKLGLKPEQIALCMKEIMESNFSKFTVNREGLYECTKSDLGKIQKSETFKKPNLNQYLTKK